MGVRENVVRSGGKHLLRRPNQILVERKQEIPARGGWNFFSVGVYR